MTNAKKILITTESREIFIVRMNGKSDIRGFCPNCAAETEMWTFDQSVSLSGISALDILRRIETGELHFLETANGHLLLCRESLEKFPTGKKSQSDKEN